MEGQVYCSQCTFEGNGEILTPDGNAVWQITTLHSRPLPFWFCTYGLFRDPGCIISGVGGRELLKVARQRQLPSPQFVMSEENEPVCTITQHNPFVNTYSIEFARGTIWTFHMPLFSTHFQGVSDMAGIVQVREWTKRVWYVLIESDPEYPLLVCALAFIHRERLRFG